MSFSEWLFSIMQERGWSQAELARQTRLTSAAISNYMGGLIPNANALLKIAKGLDLPPEFVFEKAGLFPPEKKETALDRMIAHMIAQLPEEEKEAEVEMLRTRLKLLREREAKKGEKNRRQRTSGAGS